MNTMRKWKYDRRTGLVSGPARIHDGEPRKNGTKAPSVIVASIRNSDGGEYRHYPSAIADKHGELIEQAPELLTACLALMKRLNAREHFDRADHEAMELASEAVLNRKGEPLREDA